MAVVDQDPGGAVRLVPRAPVRWLHEPDATDPAAVGSKAANLAAARRAGLPVIDGFAVTVEEIGTNPTSPSAAVAEEWRSLSDGGRLPLVVRSSSPAEDLAASSMAGMFDSVVDVRGWPAFVDAYRQVAASGAGHQMAVLVQRLVAPDLGGVLFGVDPVSGRTDHAVIVAVRGGPHHLVSGEVEGRRTVVRRSGSVVAADGDAAPVLGRRQRRRLLELSAHADAVFGRPQDVEWAIDGHRALLLQSRPVTAVAEPATGPLLGPGPVAETFPEALTALEEDLWVAPLRDATRDSLQITGSASRRKLRRSPVVAVVDGQVVVDLEATGVVRPGGRILRAVDPRPGVRRLVASWRVGRLRGAFPQLAGDAVAEVDRRLAELPPLAGLCDEDLLLVLHNVAQHLRVVHTQEMLAGALLAPDGETAAGAALREIARGKALGWSDDDIIARTPVALAVLAPTTGDRSSLPAVHQIPPAVAGAMGTREQLRLRVRWLHELTRHVVRELGGRLVARGTLARADDVRDLRLDELAAALRGDAIGAPTRRPLTIPVPARFRLSASGHVIADTADAALSGGGVGAGGGRGSGPVSHREPVPGEVLVVRTLDPALAAVLPLLSGIVAETGSPLSHLAILAREHGVPVVVGHAGALDAFSPGTHVLVDGGTGAVEVVGGERPAGAPA